MSGSSGWKSRWPLLVVGSLLLLFAIPLCRRSITLADEGYILLQSWDMLNGKVLYRDMDAFVAPGMWILLAATFKLLGASVIASRVPVLIALMTMYAAGYRITSRLAGPGWGLSTVGLLAVCTVWAFPAWTFAFYSPFSVLFALLGLERLLAYREQTRARDLWLCGLWIGLAAIFKQNYGLFALIGITASLLAIRAERGERLLGGIGDLGRIVGGTVICGAPIVLYLALTGALPAAWHSLVIHPFEFSGKHDIPYLSLAAILDPDLMKSGVEMLTYGAQPIYRVPPVLGFVRELGIVERLHVPFYWAPPVILLLGAALSYRPGAVDGDRAQTSDTRRIDAGLFSVIAMAGMVFLGVFPRADFNHLANIYQPIVIAGVVVAHRIANRRAPGVLIWQRAGVGALLLVLSLYVAVAGWWYYGLMKYLATPVSLERAGVLAREEQARRITYQVESMLARTDEGEAVLTLPDLSMLNFLADRPMPSAYYNLYEHHIAHDHGLAVIAGAESAGVRMAITRYNDFFSDRVSLRDYAPAIVEYLATHFEMAYTVGQEDFIVFQRRPEPIPRPEGESLIPFCDLSAGYQEVRYHLLFPTLYHNPGTGNEMTIAAMETPCTVRVPEQGATLSLRVGYRAPARVLRDTTLTTEIIAVGELQNELLMRRKFLVRGQGPDIHKRKLSPTIRIDLSRFAGQELSLLLRTTRRGIVLVRPLERRGFGTSWEDPLILPNSADGAPPPITAAEKQR